MIAIPQMLRMLVDVFKSRMRLEAENLFLRSTEYRIAAGTASSPTARQ